MKKLIVMFLFMIFVLAYTNAQFTKIGGGLAYGTGFHFNNVTTPQYEAALHEGPVIGIFFAGIYELNLPFHIAPSFTYFIPRTNKPTQAFGGEGTRVSEMMFDFNGHYVINSPDRFKFYGLAGLNITIAKLKWLGTSSSGSDNALGLNIGAGTYIKLSGQFDFCGEVKYIVSKYDQLMVNGGILINLDWMKKHENSNK
jgi:opacity protein-like surface antigen